MSSSVASFLSLPFASLCLNSILSRPFSYGGKTIGRRARLTSPQLQVQWMLPFQKIQLCTSQALIRAFAHPWTVILAREVQCLIGQVWVKCLSLKVGVMSIPPNPVDGEWDSGEVQKEDQVAIIRKKGRKGGEWKGRKPQVSTMVFLTISFHTYSFSHIFNFETSLSYNYTHLLPIKRQSKSHVFPTSTFWSSTSMWGKLFSARSRWTSNLSPKNVYPLPTSPNGETTG